MEKQVYIFGPQFSTFVRAVQLCCEEKGIAYRLGMTIDGQTIKMGSPEHYQYHPFGKVPVLFHNGQHYFESLAICRYLDSAFGGPSLQPDCPSQRVVVDEWSNSLATYVDRVLIRRYLLEFTFPQGPEKTVRQDVIAAVEPEVIKILNFLDRELSEKPFFKSDSFSIADAILIPMLDYLAKLPHSDRLFKEHRHLFTYLENMRQRSSGKAVLI